MENLQIISAFSNVRKSDRELDRDNMRISIVERERPDQQEVLEHFK